MDPAGRGLDSLAAVEFANAISKDFAGLQKLGHRPGEGGPDQVHYILYYIIYTYTVYNYIYILLNHVMCLFFFNNVMYVMYVMYAMYVMHAMLCYVLLLYCYVMSCHVMLGNAT